MPRSGKRLIAAFLILWIGFVVAWWFHQRPDPPPLYVVNGLPVPVQIEADGQTVHLPANSRDFIVDLPAGESEVVVRTEDGRTLATDTIEMTRGRAMAIYNVLGAAFVLHRKIWYGFGFQNEDPDYRLYVDDAFHDLEFERVQLIFEAPPERVTSRLGSGDVYLRYVGFPEGEWDWKATVAELRRTGQTDQAEAIEARVKQALPELAEN